MVATDFVREVAVKGDTQSSVAGITVDPELCTGCRARELACGLRLGLGDIADRLVQAGKLVAHG